MYFFAVSLFVDIEQCNDAQIFAYCNVTDSYTKLQLILFVMNSLICLFLKKTCSYIYNWSICYPLFYTSPTSITFLFLRVKHNTICMHLQHNI